MISLCKRLGCKFGTFIGLCGGAAIVEPGLIFHAPLTSDLILLKGVGVATFTRGSVANVLDHEQVIQELIIDAPRFTGARTDGTNSYPDDGVNPIPDVNLDGILIEGEELSRLADLLSYPTAGNIDANQGSLFIEFMPYGFDGVHYLWGSYVDASNYTTIHYDNIGVYFTRMIAGVSEVFTTAPPNLNEKNIIGVNWDNIDITKAWLNGLIGSGVIGTYSSIALNANMEIGSDGQGLNQAFADIRDVQLANYVILDADMVTLTTVSAYVYNGRKVVTNNGVGVTA